ncbi:MAG TPA: hypothetical protein VJA94_12655 [Candidatus Angelobacter sp.]
MGVSWIVISIGLISTLQPWTNTKAQLTDEDWRRAAEAVVRLNPGAVPGLPSELRAALESRGCTIPQPYDAKGHVKNVIKGEFTSAGEADWAVLCSRQKRSAILLFRSGSRRVAEFAERSDSQFLQVIGPGNEIGYTRLLTTATPKTIRQHLSYGTALAIEHAGIEDNFIGKASLVWYQSNGKWIQVAATD